MMTSDMILEQLRLEMGCCYLSDLPTLIDDQRSKMLECLCSIPQEAVTPEGWADICTYLGCQK
jgi:hypothetical protein